MTGTGVAIGFWLLAALTVGSALGIVLTQNLLHAVLYLVLAFVGLAGLFITLTADFVAVATVLIYGGAISVLVIFAIMLTPSGSRRNSDTVFFGPGLIAGGLAAAVMTFVAFRTPWNLADWDGFETTVAPIGEALVGRWALPFQIMAILLTVAMIGAIVLVRAPAQSEEPEFEESVPPIAPVNEDEARALTAGVGTRDDVGRS
jgi:NADH:ubiquinone oxidoreductase subunit 6 (subunit J)